MSMKPTSVATKPCGACKGSGRIVKSGKKKVCLSCGGTGTKGYRTK